MPPSPNRPFRLFREARPAAAVDSRLAARRGHVGHGHSIPVMRVGHVTLGRCGPVRFGLRVFGDVISRLSPSISGQKMLPSLRLSSRVSERAASPRAMQSRVGFCWARSQDIRVGLVLIAKAVGAERWVLWQVPALKCFGKTAVRYFSSEQVESNWYSNITALLSNLRCRT